MQARVQGGGPRDLPPLEIEKPKKKAFRFWPPPLYEFLDTRLTCTTLYVHTNNDRGTAKLQTKLNQCTNLLQGYKSHQLEKLFILLVYLNLRCK